MELSERLKALAKDFGGVRHWSRPTFAAQNLAGEVADNLPEIIAALQFAEDVEKLKKIGSVRFMDSRTGGILCQCILCRTTTPDGDERETVKGRGDDIYTAARKAAEAVEKGEA